MIMPRGRKPSALTQETDMTGGGAYADIVAPTRMEPNVGRIPQPMNLSAPTTKQFEPNTAGIPVGPGSNGPRVIPTNTLQNFLITAKNLTNDPIFDELLAEDIVPQPQLGKDPEDYFGI